MFRFSSSFDGKHEVVIDFPTHYVLWSKKPISDPLETPQSLDQVSTFPLILSFDTWNWIAEITMNSPHFMYLHIFWYQFMFDIFDDQNIWWQKYLTTEISIAELGWWLWSEWSSCSSA